MKAYFTDKKGSRVIVEPVEKQTEDELRKKCEQIMRKRGIESKLTIE
jgi:hypothetical protein